jgi:hypothetical protein
VLNGVAWRTLLLEALLGALAAWFALVAITALPGLRPQRIRADKPPQIDAYLEDFAVFYTAGTMLRLGDGRDVYNLEALHAAEGTVLNQPVDTFAVLPFFNPPYALLLFAPLSLLSLPNAAIVWVVATPMLACAGLWLLTRAYPARISRQGILYAVLAVVSSLPFYISAVYGQITFLLVFGLCLLYVSLRWNRTSLGVAAVLILSLKPQLLILPVLLLVLQRRYRVLAIAFTTGLALLSAVLLLAGPQVVADYVHLVQQSTSWNAENGAYVWGMHGWVGLVSGLAGGQPFAGQRSLVLLLDVCTLLLVGWIIYRGARAERDPAELLSLAVVGGLLASPHFYSADLLLLLPVLWVSYAAGGQTRKWAIVCGIAGWFVLYLHYTLLGLTRLGITTLFLLLVLALLIAAGEGRLPGRRRRALPARAPAGTVSR